MFRVTIVANSISWVSYEDTESADKAADIACNRFNGEVPLHIQSVVVE